MISNNNKLKFSKKQREYWNNADKLWNIKYGATRSGKTYLDYFLIPKRIMSTKGEGSIVLLGRTKGSIQRNIVEPLQDMYKGAVSDIGSDNTLMMFGKRVHALGAKSKDRAGELQGMGIEYAYGDEITTWNEEVFNMLMSRLDKPNSVFDGTCNPGHSKHWLKLFLDAGHDDVYQQHYRIDDNDFLLDSYKESLKAKYAGSVLYDWYIEGEWKAVDELVYTTFASHDSQYEVSLDDIPELAQITIGVDFGNSASKHAFVATGITKDYGEVYVLSSKRLDTGIGPNELSSEFADFLLDVENTFGKVDYIFADNANQVLIRGLSNELSNRGLDRAVRNCIKLTVMDRIDTTISLTNQRRLFYTKYAYTFRDALSNAMWDKKESDKGKSVRLENISVDVDTLDAFEYSFTKDIRGLNDYVRYH